MNPYIPLIHKHLLLDHTIDIYFKTNEVRVDYTYVEDSNP